jgi:malonate transporter
LVWVRAGSSLLTVLIRLKQSRDLADASLDGLNAAYPNAGFIGLPLCMLAFGHASLAPAVIGMIMTVCVLFAVAIVLIELGLQTEKKRVATMGKVVRSLVTNPLLFAPFAGWLCSGAGLTSRVVRTRFSSCWAQRQVRAHSLRSGCSLARSQKAAR